MEIQSVQFKIKNNLDLYLDASVDFVFKETKKLAVLLPGFLDTKEYPHLKELAYELAQKNFIVVRFDPTGTWNSEGDISQYTISQYLEDLKAILKFFTDLYNPIETIALIGHSMGGMISLLHAANDPKISVVTCIMSPASFVRTENYEERVVRWRKEGGHTIYQRIPGNENIKKEFRVPFSTIEDSMKYDAIDIIDKVIQPKLFIAGGIDPIISTEYAREFYERAPTPKEYVEIENIEHDYKKSSESINKVNTTILNYLHEIRLID